ncbi:hypothetical protein Tsubulata_050325 [Turnera subulata]|uniref:Uncharacterized protein n=1 Tax=Turnera subulata TaxID=218843 RepID=A0A9Q0GHM1_9ROSI|nr:hypothetical protein Tsubulata_050325 [Turnera subulata]
MTQRSVGRYYSERDDPFPQRVALPDVGLEDCWGFTEAIFYPPEEDDTNEDSRCRLLAHYQAPPYIAHDFGAPWGTLVLWTFKLNHRVATGLRPELNGMPTLYEAEM